MFVLNVSSVVIASVSGRVLQSGEENVDFRCLWLSEDILCPSVALLQPQYSEFIALKSPLLGFADELPISSKFDDPSAEFYEKCRGTMVSSVIVSNCNWTYTCSVCISPGRQGFHLFIYVSKSLKTSIVPNLSTGIGGIVDAYEHVFSCQIQQ